MVPWYYKVLLLDSVQSEERAEASGFVGSSAAVVTEATRWDVIQFRLLK